MNVSPPLAVSEPSQPPPPSPLSSPGAERRRERGNPPDPPFAWGLGRRLGVAGGMIAALWLAAAWALTGG
ncbi:MAG: hypothetical protein HQL51_07815 [Magnetococcales bacterium]|nr:hypothetical protein [Magnetococcales bacterium]